MSAETKTTTTTAPAAAAEARTTNNSTPPHKQNDPPPQDEEQQRYKYLVVDSGPIIKLTTGLSSGLWKKAETFVTVPAVLTEIRDAKARSHLQSLPFPMNVRAPSQLAMQKVSEFAKLTGDYNSLSHVDVQVLALLYDLEREACPGGDLSHVRTTPKRTIGLGQLQELGDGRNNKDDSNKHTTEDGCKSVEQKVGIVEAEDCIVDIDVDDDTEEEDEQEVEKNQEGNGEAKRGSDSDRNNETSEATSITTTRQSPRTWAALLNPIAAKPVDQQVAGPATSQMKLVGARNSEARNDDGGGSQFSDAEDEDSDVGSLDEDNDCDVRIRDPREMLEEDANNNALEKELQTDFPSLAASMTVPYEGSEGEEGDDGDDCDDDDDNACKADDPERDGQQASIRKQQQQEDEDRKRRSLQPLTKSGKLYNSFTKYGDLMKPKPKKKATTGVPTTKEVIAPGVNKIDSTSAAKNEDVSGNENSHSRIMGGSGFAGQGDDVEDDGEGWITCSKDITKMKSAGALDPTRDPSKLDGTKSSQPQGPPINQRAACATTDFAMQNVILQMNLELLSVEGIKVRKLKNWVTRCGACFTVYTNSNNAGPLGKRMFCERCGSDFMQRIAASVDGKTGRLRLHLSKKYKHNLRGTKFSLPKPGTHNRFQGDLLLREDQLMMGAWNQKVKMRSGGNARNAAQSLFGSDIATNVGCHANSMTGDDIRVGFGRRNPNAAKGRERRGKKKKSSNKACGLRRY